MKSANFLCFLFFNVHKDNMFTIQIEDGREAPLKPSNINSNTFKPGFLSCFAFSPPSSSSRSSSPSTSSSSSPLFILYFLFSCSSSSSLTSSFLGGLKCNLGKLSWHSQDVYNYVKSINILSIHFLIRDP